MENKKNNTKKIVIAALIAILIVGLIGFNVWNASQTETEGGVARNALPVHWAYPTSQTIVSSVSARGNVDLRERTVVFPETQAQIVTVHVSVGDVVNAGDLLVTYDDTMLETLHDQLAEAHLALRSAELGLAAATIAPNNTEILAAENQIEQARSNIASTSAQLAQADLQIVQLEDNIASARATMADVQLLFNSGVSPRIELDNAIDAVRRLEDQLAIAISQRETTALALPMAHEAERLAVAQLNSIRNRNAQPQAVNQAQVQQVAIERAQLAIAQIERNIESFQLEERATVAGTVLNVLVQEGEMSVASRPLMEIADISEQNLVITVHVPENDAGNLAVGQEVEISGAAIGNQRYEGVIELIHPLAAPRQMGSTLETVVTIEIAIIGSSRLRAGNTVDATIVTAVSEDARVVPLMSTVNAGGGTTFVYVINNEMELERRDVTLGEFSAMYIEAFGIEDGDRIVANPNSAMFPGLQVRPVPPLSMG